jgi:protein-S-isoprenylcysteine O-methyltransferase Ste14
MFGDQAMSILSYLALAAIVFAVSLVVFRVVALNYRLYGRLKPLATTLQVAIFALHAALFHVGLMTTRWPRFPDSSLQAVLGALVGAGGLVLLFAGIGVFGSLARMIGCRVDALKQSGVYRYSRNPQLVGYGFFILAFIIIWPSWRTLIATIVYCGMAHVMSSVEEQHLRKQYGTSYGAYCQRTPRYVGIPRPY